MACGYFDGKNQQIVGQSMPVPEYPDSVGSQGILWPVPFAAILDGLLGEGLDILLSLVLAVVDFFYFFLDFLDQGIRVSLRVGLVSADSI